MTLVPATEASLKRAMRDPRYWQSGHPERSAYSAWVSDGWQALGKASPGGRTAEGLVFVRAYDCTRNGHAEHVSAHTRSAAPGRDSQDGGATVVPASHWMRGGAAPGTGLPALPGPGGRMPPLPLPRFPSGGLDKWLPRGIGPRSPARPGQVETAPPNEAGEEPANPGAAQAPAEPLLPSPPTVDDLLAASPLTKKNIGPWNADQHQRGGGEAQRDADRRAITTAPGETIGPDRIAYPLPDGRIVVTRPSTSDGEPPTMEVARPNPNKPGRFIPTHKIRY